MNFGGGESQLLDLAGVATVRVVSYANDTTLEVDLPTTGSWFAKNWYVIFVIVLIFVACIVSVVVSVLRWNKRQSQRTKREVKNKAGFLSGAQRVANSFTVGGGTSSKGKDKPAEGPKISGSANKEEKYSSPVGQTSKKATSGGRSGGPPSGSANLPSSSKTSSAASLVRDDDDDDGVYAFKGRDAK